MSAPPILARLEAIDGAKPQTSGWWKASCPAHEDRHASFGWRESTTTEGRATVVLSCRAGCSNESIVEALGGTMADLFEPRADKPRPTVVREIEYPILDAAGVLHATHVRRDYSDGSKQMPWRTPDGKWKLGRSPATLPLYGSERLPSWPADARIVVTEGEKAADALLDAGRHALGTVCGAADTPEAEVLEALRDRHVVLWPDADDVGRDHMLRIAERLEGVAASVRWLEPPEDAPKGWDAADALADATDPVAVVKGLGGRIVAVPSATADPVAEDDEDGYFLSPAQVYDGAPPVESVVPGIAAHGAVTNLDGKPKAGKTTFVMALINAGLNPDRRFLGHQVEFDVVVYLTEQGHDSLKEQLAGAGIGRDVVGRVEIVEWGAVHHLGWEATLAMVRRRIERKHRDARVLLVVDTFSKWARTRDENDATATMDAYRPLLLLTQDLRTATIALRHGRKGDLADVTDSARGSNAASGEADIILHLGRAEGRPGEGRNVRRLRGIGRLSGIPEDLYIELRDGEYVALAEGEEYQSNQHRSAVLAALAAASGPMPLEAIVDATGIARPRVQAALAELMHHTRLEVERTGGGRKGDPYLYAVSAQNPVATAFGGTVQSGSAQNPVPATDNEFCAPSHAQNGASGDGFRQEPSFRTELVVDTPARAREGSTASVSCADYLTHRSWHRRTGSGYVCDACNPAMAA